MKMCLIHKWKYLPMLKCVRRRVCAKCVKKQKVTAVNVINGENVGKWVDDNDP